MFTTYPISGKFYLYSFALSFMLSIIITKIFIEVLSRCSFVEMVSCKDKKKVIPFGGVAVILPFLITIWVFYFLGAIDSRNLNLLLVMTLNISLMFFTGLYDDIIGSSPRVKITIQILIALILYLFGFRIERIGDWFELNNFSFLMTALWIVGITNSINLIDGEDGLASGIILLSCLTLFVVYLNRNIYEASFFSIVLSGSILGFFIFNFPPAKIILGDTGSLPIGLLAALITLLPLNQGFTDEIYYLIPVIVFLIPIIDTSLSFFRRILKGKSPFLKDEKHLHHRLVHLGLTPLQSISILFGVCIYFDLIFLVPVYHITLIPNFIPYFSIFAIINIAFILKNLKYFEKKYEFNNRKDNI